MDRYIVVPYYTGGMEGKLRPNAPEWDIQTDVGRRLNVRLDKDAAYEICIELNAAWEDKTHG